MNARRYDVQPHSRVFVNPSEAGQNLQQKVDARKAEMGANYLCHKDNVITKDSTPKRPAAWMIPRILSFDGATAVHDVTPEQQKELQGTVVWSLSFLGDAPSVVDRYGKTHKPRALVFEDEQSNTR